MLFKKGRIEVRIGMRFSEVIEVSIFDGTEEHFRDFPHDTPLKDILEMAVKYF